MTRHLPTSHFGRKKSTGKTKFILLGSKLEVLVITKITMCTKVTKT